MQSIFNLVIISIFSVTILFSGTTKEKLALEAEKEKYLQYSAELKKKTLDKPIVNNHSESQKVRVSVNPNDLPVAKLQMIEIDMSRDNVWGLVSATVDYWYGEGGWTIFYDYDQVGSCDDVTLCYYACLDADENGNCTNYDWQYFTEAYESQTNYVYFFEGYDYYIGAYDSVNDGGTDISVTGEDGMVWTTHSSSSGTTLSDAFNVNDISYECGDGSCTSGESHEDCPEDCGLEGCMDPGADTYNPDAEVHDYSCNAYPGANALYYWGTDYDCPASGCDNGAFGCYLDCNPIGGWCSWDFDGDGVGDSIGNGECSPLAEDADGDGYYDSPDMICFECDGSDCIDCDEECTTGPYVDEFGIECGSGSCDDSLLSVTMTDSYGDSWNGNVLTIGSWSGTNENLDGTTGIESQTASACVDLTVANDVTCNGGTFQYEVSWSISNAEGNELLSGGAPYAGCLGDCENQGYGCTDSSAPEYDPDATIDDGSCWADCTGTISYISDGYCDSSSNNEGCGWDGGDCCPGDCVTPCEDPTNTSGCYDCATSGGDCLDCIDPDSADLAAGGQCDPNIDTPDAPSSISCEGNFDAADGPQIDLSWDAVDGADHYEVFYFYETCEEQGLVTCADGSCVATEDECPDLSCTDIGGITNYISDGDCDIFNNNETCGWDGGDCCGSTCTPADYSCADACSQECLDPAASDDCCVDSSCDFHDDGTTGGSADCTDCDYDHTAYGSECCDTAWSEYGLSCAALAADYNWDCSGCNCPGDTGGTTGGGDDVCADEYCADGTYWDGSTCYSCSWCLNNGDDSACSTESGNDCCGACGGSFDGDCDGGATDGGATDGGATDGGADDCDPNDCYELGEVMGWGPCSIDSDCDWYTCANDTDIEFCGPEVNFSCLVEDVCFGRTAGDDDEHDIKMVINGILMKMQHEGVYYMNVLHNLGLLNSNNDREWVSLGTTTDTTMTIIGVGDSMWSFGVTANNLGGASSMTIVDDCQGGAEPIWDEDITGLTAEGVDYEDEYLDTHSAVEWMWNPLLDGTSCEENGSITCWDGSCELTENECPEPGDCADCEFDFTAYGSECCDTAWGEFGLNCEELETGYNWDCSGCNCPGDAPPVCGDGACTGSETFDSCPSDCEAPPEACYIYDCQGAMLDNNSPYYSNYDCLVDSQECPCDGVTYEGDNLCDDGAYLGNTGIYIDLDCAEWAYDGGDCSGRENNQAVVNGKDFIRPIITEDESDNPTIINIATGEIIPGTSNGNRAVSYTINVSCSACVEDANGDIVDWSDSWDTNGTEFLVYGFDAGAEVCGNVVGRSTEYGATNPSADVCANAGVDSCINGDATDDGSVDILDLVAIVGYILDQDTNSVNHPCADYDGDGTITILDLVSMVEYILDDGSERTVNATSATINIDSGSLHMTANGGIDGIQMTLSHDADFVINLTDKALVAEYKTSGNQTTLIILKPEGEKIFTSEGDFEVVEVIAANTSGVINVMVAYEKFVLRAAYPNPFNPTTSLELAVPVAGHVSVQVYNLMGQVVATLADGFMEANTYKTLSWDASNVSSGMYLVKAQTANTVVTQKIMYLK